MTRIIKTIAIKEEHERFINEHSLSLSRLVQRVLDEMIEKEKKRAVEARPKARDHERLKG